MTNLERQEYQIQRQAFEKRNGHAGKVFWFTGLSGSGKSTLANAVHKRLFEAGIHSIVLDGDNTRLGINKDLGFSVEDRNENIRRVSEIAKLFADTGHVVITSFISPFEKNRALAKEIISEDDFVEVHIACSIEKCEQRDVKGLYKKVRSGEITEFTGISSPYEIPKNPDICIQTEKQSVEESAELLYSELRSKL